ncbi:MAG: hypothetical protein E7211_18825 [Clostridium lundense]|nr:hypothetical protein [Clostridium lundense]
MSGALFGRTCEGCKHIKEEPFNKTVCYRCFAPGEWCGRVVGIKRYDPFIPAWCPRMKEFKEAARNG